jgi:hypothetical protein
MRTVSPKGRGPAGIGHPEYWIIRGCRVRVAAQVREVDQAYRHDLVLFNPLKDRAEISFAAALGLQLNRF